MSSLTDTMRTSVPTLCAALPIVTVWSGSSSTTKVIVLFVSMGSVLYKFSAVSSYMAMSKSTFSSDLVRPVF